MPPAPRGETPRRRAPRPAMRHAPPDPSAPGADAGPRTKPRLLGPPSCVLQQVVHQPAQGHHAPLPGQRDEDVRSGQRFSFYASAAEAKVATAMGCSPRRAGGTPPCLEANDRTGAGAGSAIRMVVEQCRLKITTGPWKAGRETLERELKRCGRRARGPGSSPMRSPARAILQRAALQDDARPGKPLRHQQGDDSLIRRLVVPDVRDVRRPPKMH